MVCSCWVRAACLPGPLGCPGCLGALGAIRLGRHGRCPVLAPLNFSGQLLLLFTSGETRLTEPHIAPDTSFTRRRRGASLLPRVSQITGHSPQTLCPAVGTGAGWVSDEPGASRAVWGGKCPPQVPRTPRNTLAFKLLPTQPAFSAWPSSPPAARSLKAPRPPRPSWLTASYLQTTAPAARPGALPRSHVDSGLLWMLGWPSGRPLPQL